MPEPWLVVLLIPLTGLAVAAWLRGAHLQPILSGSMAPAHPQGSMLFVEPVGLEDVRPGMVIVFEDPQHPGHLVAHRVTARIPGESPSWRTRGDANLTDDPLPVRPQAIRGQAVVSVRGLGTLVHALRWPRNVIVLVGLPALLLMASEVRSFRARHLSPSAPCRRCPHAGSS